MKGAVGIWPVRVEAAGLAEELVRRLSGELFRPWEQSGSQRVFFQQSFPLHSQWVLIMATGIAARFVDGLLQDKHHDPAVVVVDEAARYAIALVGGHEGGANALAYRVANAVGATPVVTTATEATRPLVVGIGCRKGVSAEQVEAAVLHALTIRAAARARGVGVEAGNDEAGALRAAGGRVSGEGRLAALAEVRELVTVDLKAEEPGLVAFSRAVGVPLRVIARHQIEQRAWVTRASEWVRQSIGVEGVCEPCALIACPRGRLVVAKTALDGVAVAVVEDDWRRAP
jgi:cobalt-precorrin 5A hydrolase